MELLHAAAQDCRNCPLWKCATQAVFGEGPPAAKLMLVGEQPGDREDQAGEPFVGPAGQELDRALEAAGISTVHPSSILRQRGDSERRRAREDFIADLTQVKNLLEGGGRVATGAEEDGG